MFKLGQKVWDIRHGWGIVEAVEKDNFPFYVQFEKTGAWYSREGKGHVFENRTLFFEEIPIPESALVPKKWRAKHGEELFYYIDCFGMVNYRYESNSYTDAHLYKIGNYFQTEEEAMESKFYKVFHEGGE